MRQACVCQISRQRRRPFHDSRRRSGPWQRRRAGPRWPPRRHPRQVHRASRKHQLRRPSSPSASTGALVLPAIRFGKALASITRKPRHAMHPQPAHPPPMSPHPAPSGRCSSGDRPSPTARGNRRSAPHPSAPPARGAALPRSAAPATGCAAIWRRNFTAASISSTSSFGRKRIRRDHRMLQRIGRCACRICPRLVGRQFDRPIDMPEKRVRRQQAAARPRAGIRVENACK